MGIASAGDSSMTGVAEESGGFFSSLLGSLRSHVEDRIKSPFAGAFLISWLIVNWKALLIVAFSSTSIEARIALVSTSHLTFATTLGFPLLYAFCGVIGYYVIATLFLVLFEFYGVGRRAVGRRFDKDTWVDPETYIQFKEKSQKQIDYYKGLAADKLEQITELRSESSRMDAENKVLKSSIEEKEQELAVSSNKNHILSTALQAEKTESEGLMSALRAESNRQANLRNALDLAKVTLAKTLYFLNQAQPDARQVLGGTGLMGASIARPRSQADAGELSKDIERAQSAIAAAE